MNTSLFFIVGLLIFYKWIDAAPIIKDGTANNVCKESDSYIPISGSCDLYILCKDFKPSNEICPDGLNFNNATKYPVSPCSLPKDVPCTGQISQQPKPKDNCPRQNGQFPISSDGKNDCKKYYSCKEGVATETTCEDGLVFNPDSAHCDKPDTVPSCNENDTAKKPDTNSSKAEETTTSANKTTSVPENEAQNVSQTIDSMTAPTVEPSPSPLNNTAANTTIGCPLEPTEAPQNDTATSSKTPDYKMIVLPTGSPNSTTSNTTEPSSDSGTPPSNTTEPSSDSGTPSSNTTKPSSDSGTPSSNSTEPSSDSGTPSSNSTEPSSDSGTPSSNSTEPSSDSGKPSPNSTKPSSDSTTPSSDSTSKKPDTIDSNIASTKAPASEPVTALIKYGSISMSDVVVSIPINKRK